MWLLDNVPPSNVLEGDRLLATSTDPWSIVAIADNGYGPCSVHHQWTWDQLWLQARQDAEAVIETLGCATTGKAFLLVLGWFIQKECEEKGRKLQASSLTAGPGYSRMYLERNNYDYKRGV